MVKLEVPLCGVARTDLLKQSRGHDYRHFNFGEGEGRYHLGDDNTTYNLFNFGDRSREPGRREKKFQRSMLVASDPDRDLRSFRRHRGIRVDGTCEWLWGSDETAELLESSELQFLYITGLAGTGKTEAALFLLDTIPDRITSARPDASPCVVHFFCSSKNGRFLGEINVLRSLLFQLCSYTAFLRQVEEAFEQYCFPRGGLLDDSEALWTVLDAILQDPAARDVVILLDAVDDLPQPAREGIFDHFNFIRRQNIARKISTKVIVTCRDISTVPLRLRLLGSHLTLEGFAIEEDLEIYVKAKAAELADSMSYPDDVRRDITQTLLERNGGTFLWMAIVVRHLQSTHTKAMDVSRRLKEIPQDLSKLYDEILGKVSAEAHDQVQFLLHIMCAAHRQMTKDEVMLAFCLHGNSWTSSSMPKFWKYEHLIKERTDLVIYDSEQETLSFLHDTVKEYLTATSTPGGQKRSWLYQWIVILWDVLLGLVICIWCPSRLRRRLIRRIFHVDSKYANYLCFEFAFKALGLDTSSRDDAAMRSRSLQKYSRESIQLHASASWSLVRSRFPWKDSKWSKNSRRTELWMNEAARLDDRTLGALLDSLTAANPRCEFGTVETLSSLLDVAAGHGNVGSMSVTLSRGAKIDSGDNGPLRSAALGYHVNAVKLLLDHSAEVDGKSRGNDALLFSMLRSSAASLSYNNVEVTGDATLIAGIEYHSTSTDFFGAFNHPATSSGVAYQEIVLLLISASPDLEAVDDDGCTFLIHAARNHQWSFVKRLVDLGADVNSVDRNNESPLSAAVRLPKRAAVFENVTVKGRAFAFLGGIVVRNITRPSDSADETASVRTWKEAVLELVERTDNLENTNVDGRSVLSLASEAAEPWIIEALLSKGASPHSVDRDGYSPLMYSCRLPRFWDIFIENLHVGDNAIVYAGGVSHEPLGDERTKDSGQATYTDRLRRHVTTELLLKSGANPNTSAYNGDTALSLAVIDALQDVAALLLMHGACRAPFERIREATLQYFTLRNASFDDNTRGQISAPGNIATFDTIAMCGRSQVAFGPWTSDSDPSVTARIEKISHLCPATVLKRITVRHKGRVAFGLDDLSTLNVSDARNFDAAWACAASFQDVCVRDNAWWQFAVDIKPDWDPLCRPSAMDFSLMPRCHFSNIVLQGNAKLETGNCIFAKRDGVIQAVTTQYPGNFTRDVVVAECARWRACGFTAGSADGPALRVFEALERLTGEDGDAIHRL